MTHAPQHAALRFAAVRAARPTEPINARDPLREPSGGFRIFHLGGSVSRHGCVDKWDTNP